MTTRPSLAIVNLTAHEVVVMSSGPASAEFRPSGQVARLRERTTPSDPIRTNRCEIPTITVAYQDIVDDLPDPRPDTVYIVSRVLAAAVHRTDLVFPADEVLDAAGRIIGCRSLGRFDQGGEVHNA